MPLAVSCPVCHAAQTVPDDAAGRTVRCPGCQAEFPARPATPAPAVTRRQLLPWVIGLAVLGVAGVAAYRFLNAATPTDTGALNVPLPLPSV